MLEVQLTMENSEALRFQQNQLWHSDSLLSRSWLLKPFPFFLVNIMEAIKYLKGVYKNIDRAKIYYALRQLKVKFITKESVDVISAIVACESAGISAPTVELLSHILDTSPSVLRIRLHTLGDKGLLNLHYMTTSIAGCLYAYSIDQKLRDLL